MLKKAASAILHATGAVRPSLVYDLLRRRYARMIPFAKNCHLEQLSLGDGVARTRLPDRPELSNHIASQHAAALFLLGESCSGGAVVGMFAQQVLSILPVAASADIQYLEVARGPITATARVVGDTSHLRTKLQREGKVVFEVAVSMSDEAGSEVATMTVQWHVRKKRKK